MFDHCSPPPTDRGCCFPPPPPLPAPGPGTDKQECALLSCLRKTHLWKTHSCCTRVSFVRRYQSTMCPRHQKKPTEHFRKGEAISPILQMGKTISKEIKGITPRESCTLTYVSITVWSTLELHQPCRWGEILSCSASPPPIHKAETQVSSHWAGEYDTLQDSAPCPQILQAVSLQSYQQAKFKLDAKLVTRASSGNNPASPLLLSPIA